jgi:hypothetical protein
MENTKKEADEKAVLDPHMGVGTVAKSMKITAVRTRGSKYGVKGDAEVTVVFDVDGAGRYAWEFAWEVTEKRRRELFGSRRISVRPEWPYNSPDKKTHGLVTYTPRIDYGFEVEQWKMEKLSDLIEIAKEYGAVVEQMIVPGNLAERVVQLFNKLNVYPTVSYYPSVEVVNHQFRFSVNVESHRYDGRGLAVYLKPTPFWERESNSVSEDLELTAAEMATYTEQQADELVRKLCDQLNDAMLRMEAMRLLDERLKADGGVRRCSNLGPQDVTLCSVYDTDKKATLTFADGADLMAKVVALDIEKLKQELKVEAAVEQDEIAERKAALERKEEVRAEKAAKVKLAEQWAALQAEATVFNGSKA